MILKLFATALLFLATQAHAAVVYTDIDDVTIKIGSAVPSYNLNLNNDATTDFILSHGIFMNLMRISSPNTTTNRWVQDPVGDVNYPDQLNAGEVIGSGEIFVSFSGWNFGRRTVPGAAWLDPGTLEGGGGLGFLGLEFDIMGATHYGWAQLDYSAQGIDGGILLDYAYESEAGVSILAGDTGPALVPLPAAAWLFMSGLIGLVWKGRKAHQSVA